MPVPRNDVPASGDEDRHYRCLTKSAYASPLPATRAAYALEQQRPGRRYDVYTCPYCGDYHIGRQTSRRLACMEPATQISIERVQELANAFVAERERRLIGSGPECGEHYLITVQPPAAMLIVRRVDATDTPQPTCGSRPMGLQAWCLVLGLCGFMLGRWSC